MEGNSIERLVEECRKGNTVAFKSLFDLLHKDIFRFIRSRSASREDALDIVQEVFTDLWRSLQRNKFVYTSDKEFYSFIYTIARRRVQKTYLFGKKNISLEDLEEMPEDEAQETALVLEALESLEDNDSEVIRLRYFEGLTFPEIAKLLRKGESAVRTRHHRALDKLREILRYEE